MPRAKRGGDLARVLDERAAGQPRRDEMRVLIHGQHGHPVRRIIGEPEPPIHFADRVGEGPAARHDQQSTRAGGGADRRERGVEMFSARQQPAAELHDGFDDACLGPTVRQVDSRLPRVSARVADHHASRIAAEVGIPEAVECA